MPTPAEVTPAANAIALANGLPDAPVRMARTARATGIAFLEIDVKQRNSGVTASVQEDAFVVLLQMKAESDFDLYADGKLIEPQGFTAGDVAIFDLRAKIASDTRDPYHAVDFYLPRRALLAMGEDGDVPRHIQELRQTLGTSIPDPVARNLMLAMRPALSARPEETSELFVDHVATALAVHLATTYGDGGSVPRQWGAGLAPWQERCAKELIEANIEGGVTLNDLAGACDLSIRHFTRAFRQSTGVAPYQWLQQRRLDKARGLLANSAHSLSDIALACGFADQSHFTRTFSRSAGMTPRTWRRMRRV